MVNHIYIGQSHWTLETPFELEWTPDGEQFTLPNPDSPEESNIHYQLIPTAELPAVGGQISAETEIRRIYLQDGLEAREHLIADSKEVYAVYAEMEREKTLILLDIRYPNLFEGSPFLFNYFALERNLMEDDQIILHSCYIIHEGQAILFTAPSETGKSTQGNHWAKLFGAEVINGDRSLLAKKDGIWKAYGSPFSGTSGICLNRQAPIKAIVYLHQAPENRLEKTQPLQAFMKLYGQITVNSWNPDFADKVCTLLDDLVQQVPVYDFYLTKEEDSAEYLLYHLGTGN